MISQRIGLLAHRGSSDNLQNRNCSSAQQSTFHVLCNTQDCIHGISDATGLVIMAEMSSKRGSKVLDDFEREDLEQVESERPTKRLKTLLVEDDFSDEEDSVSGNKRGVPAWNDESDTGGQGLKVNHEFARRFEHNKKREELHKRK